MHSSSFRIPESIPSSVDLIWHGLNDAKNLERFLASTIPWGECDVRRDGRGYLILRHDSFETTPLKKNESLVFFEHWLCDLLAHQKKILIDFKEGGDVLQEVVSLLKRHTVPQSQLWLSTNLKDVSLEDFESLRKQFPQAIVQSTIPLRFMFKEMNADDRESWFTMNRGLGASRLSASWKDLPTREEIEQIRKQGFEVNLYHVDTIEAFRKAILLKPDSITSDFCFPEFKLYGRGSGEKDIYLHP